VVTTKVSLPGATTATVGSHSSVVIHRAFTGC
jgi:hypothetical protein